MDSLGRVWGCILVWPLLLASAQAQKDPVTDFCRRFGHQTAVVDRRLYIDGGLVNWNPMTTYPANYTNTWLLYQDLDHNASSGMPQLNSNLTKNSTVPDVSGGFLWADEINKMLFLFGGEYYGQPPPSSGLELWAYDILNDFWVSRGPPPQSADINSIAYGAGVSVSERAEGYYYGGWLSNTSDSDWSGPSRATSSLLRYDYVADSWSNNSGPDEVRRAEGTLLYLPAGDGGMLVYMGGVTDPYGNGTIFPQSMSTVFLYDVLSSKWYSQNTTGAVPEDRRRFCAGVAWADDRSSYNIYLYGGAGFGADTSGFDDVYVLSIPSFTWIKLYPTDTNGTGSYPHHSLTCNVISGAQMIVIGGTFPLSDDCDAASQWGTHNIDMTESRPPNRALWQLFDPSQTDYTVPSTIFSAIGGNDTGGATVTTPAAGWDSADLAVLLTRVASVAARTATRVVTTSTDAAGSSGDSLSKGSIAGIAIGGVAAVVLLVVGCWWALLRRYRKRRATAATAAVAPGRGGYYPGHPQMAMIPSQTGHPTWSPHQGNIGYPPPSPYSPESSVAVAAMSPPPIELAAVSHTDTEVGTKTTVKLDMQTIEGIPTQQQQQQQQDDPSGRHETFYHP